MIMAALLPLTDLDGALKSRTGYPFIAIFHQAVKFVPGSTAMSAIVAIMGISSMTDSVATCSRIIFAFARDRGIPGWSVLRKVRYPPSQLHY